MYEEKELFKKDTTASWESVGENGQPIKPEQELEVNNAPQEEVTEEPQESLVEETQVSQQEQVQTDIPRTETNKEYNMRMLREEREQYQRERDELAQRLAQYEKKQEPQEEEFVSDVADTDLVEGKHLSKMGRELKNIKQQLAQYQQVAQENSVKMRIQTEFPDWNKIVTPQAVKELEKRYPTIYNTLNSSNDTYGTAASAYDLIKSLGIYKDDSKYVAQKAAIQSNNQKPRASATLAPQTGTTPLDHATDFANGLSEELKAKLYREMNEYSAY